MGNTETEIDMDTPRPLTVPNLKVEGSGHQSTGYVGVYTLTNTSDELYEVVENAFSGEAVLAISVENQQLKPKNRRGFLLFEPFKERHYQWIGSLSL